MLVRYDQRLLATNVHTMIKAWESDHFSEYPCLPDTGQMLVRVHLIGEEVSELTLAAADYDLVAMADALGDLDVVNVGTWFAFGLWQSRSPVLFLPFNEPYGKKTVLGSQRSVLRANQRINAAISDLSSAYFLEDFSSCKSALVNLDYAVGNCWEEIGLMDCRQEVSDEILRSNLSKLDPLTGKVIKSQAGRVMKGPDYSPPDLKSILIRHGKLSA